MDASSHASADVTPGPLLGAPGRRRQLRGGHLVRVPTPSPSARCWPGRSSTRSNERLRSSVSTASSSPRAPDELTIYAGFLTDPDGNRAVLRSCRVTPVTSTRGSGCSGRCVSSGRRSRISSARCTTARWQSFFDPSFPAGRQNYWKSSLLPELSDGAIDTIVAVRLRHALPPLDRLHPSLPRRLQPRRSDRRRPTVIARRATTSSSSRTGPRPPTQPGTSAGRGRSTRRCSRTQPRTSSRTS